MVLEDKAPVTFIDGSKYRVVHTGGGSWFLADADEWDNGKIFKRAKVDKESFTTRLLGYYRAGFFPYVDSSHDLERMINALDDQLIRTGDLGLSNGQTIEFENGDRYTVHLREGGRSYLSRNSGRNDKIFDTLRVPSRDYAKRVLGYYDGGLFPYCRTVPDMIKLIDSINSDLKKIQGEETPSDSSTKIYKKNETVELGKHLTGAVRKDTWGWYWANNDGLNAAPFVTLGVDKNDFITRQGVRIVSDGGFPYVGSCEDLTKVLNALKSAITALESGAKKPKQEGKLKEGHTVRFEGIETPYTVTHHGGWYLNNGDDNRRPFEMKGINAESFSVDVLGYYDSGAWPEARSLEDLEKLLNALTAAKSVKKKTEPVLKEGDIIKFPGYSGAYEVILRANWWFLHNTSTDRNDHIFRLYGIDDEHTSKAVLGYYEEGGFPECKSASDLDKLIRTLQEIGRKWERGKSFDSITGPKPPGLSLGDKVQFEGIPTKFTVDGRPNHYYLYSTSTDNDLIFGKYGINKGDFTKAVLGYYGGGMWPECRTLGDLDKLIKAVKEFVHKKTTGESEKPKVSEGEVFLTTVLTESLTEEVNREIARQVLCKADGEKKAGPSLDIRRPKRISL